MKYLLDTCTLSYFVRGEPHVLQRIKTTQPTELGISTITTMEIEFGFSLDPVRAARIRPVLNTLLDNIHILPFTREDAHAAGTIRAVLQRNGTPIGAYDLLLAGCAFHRKLIFVTTNTKEFQRVAGLIVEDWK